MSHVTDTATTLKVFLFTDLVGSTELKRRLGDAAGAAALAAHDALFRRCLAAHGGREHDHAGDGFFAIFDVPSAALRCAVEFLDELPRLEVGEPLRVRIGIHMGEIVRLAVDGFATLDRGPAGATAGAGRLVGLAVDTAARVMGLARGGQILLTRGAFDSARQQLLVGPGGVPLQWRAHGSYLFAGLEDPLEIFEVGIEGSAPLSPPPDSEKGRRAAAPGEEATLGWRPAAGRVVPGREHWVLAERVGEGGFGEVWVATHAKTGEKRIFKFCFDPERVRGLRREVVLFRLLKESLGDRDDIARILDWQLDRAPYFLEAEYTAAGDLASWARERGGLAEVPLAVRLEIVVQTAVALGAAHSVGVLHKDIKPANVLITEIRETGVPRASLTDFGIGLVTSRQALEVGGVTVAGFTQTLLASSASSQSGTRLYMAPELIEGKPPTTLSDIYSLGVLLLQSVIGDFSRAMAPGWEREVGDDLLREDVAAATDGDPARRIASAGELASRLRGLDGRRAERVERERMRRETEQMRHEAERSRRRRRQFAVASVAGILLTLSVALVAWRETGLRRVGEEAQYVMSVQLAASHLDQDNRSKARKALLRAPERLRGWEWGHLVDRAYPDTTLQPKIAVPAETAAAIWKGAEAVVVATLHTLPASVRFATDEARLVSTATREVKIWDLGKPDLPLLTVEVPAGGRPASLSHDGRVLATVHDDGTAALHDAATGRSLHSLSGHTETLFFGRFSPDDSLLVTSSRDQTLRVWETATGQSLHVFSEAERELPVLDAAFLAEGTHLLVPSRDQSLVILDLRNGREAGRIQGPRVPGFVPMFVSPDGRFVVSLDRLDGSGLDGAHPQKLSAPPLVWSADRGERLYDVPLLSGRLFTGAVFSPDGSVLASSYRDGAVHLIAAETGGELAVLTGDFDSAFSVDWSADGARLAVGELDGTIRILAPAAEGARRDRLAGHDDLVIQAVWSPDGTRLASVSYDHTVVVWDMATYERLATFAHPEPVLDAEWSPDGSLLLTATGTHNHLWVVSAEKLLWSEPRQQPLDMDLHWTGFRFFRALWPDRRFSPDGTRLLPAFEERIVDTASGATVVTLEDGDNDYDGAGYGPQGARILARRRGPSFPATVWDAESGRRLHALGSEIQTARFSPDGGRIVTGSVDGSVRIWDAASGAEILVIPAHRHSATVARFDPTGARLLTCSWDQTNAVWDATTGERLATLAGYEDVVRDASFSPDGTRVLTLGLDHTVRIWDLGGRELLTISPDATVHEARFSPDGRTIAMPLMDGTVRLYHTIRWRELAALGDDTMPLEERVRRWRSVR